MKPKINKKYKELNVETGKQKVLEVLIKFPEKEFSLSDLAREAGVAKANIGLILDEFVSLGFINIEKLSKIWRIRANILNFNFQRAKIVYNLNFIYQSGLVEFLVEYFKNPKNIILIGSFRKGEDISTSDIDIAIEDESVNETESISLKELSDFEKLIGRKIQIHLFNRKKVDINLFNNLANGILLYGFLEVNK